MARAASNTIPARTLALALTAIVLLAFPLPFGAVKFVHGRRVRAADRQIAVIAAAVERSRPAPGSFLMGPGDRPPALDDRCTAAAPAPLERTSAGQHLSLSPDRWGNAYLVLSSRNTVWVLSAGADGILQTPCDSAGMTAGDDRGAPIRD